MGAFYAMVTKAEKDALWRRIRGLGAPTPNMNFSPLSRLDDLENLYKNRYSIFGPTVVRSSMLNKKEALVNAGAEIHTHGKCYVSENVSVFRKNTFVRARVMASLFMNPVVPLTGPFLIPDARLTIEGGDVFRSAFAATSELMIEDSKIQDGNIYIESATGAHLKDARIDKTDINLTVFPGPRPTFSQPALLQGWMLQRSSVHMKIRGTYLWVLAINSHVDAGGQDDMVIDCRTVAGSGELREQLGLVLINEEIHGSEELLAALRAQNSWPPVSASDDLPF